MRLSLTIIVACITFTSLVAFTKPKIVTITKIETKYEKVECVKTQLPKTGAFTFNQK